MPIDLQLKLILLLAIKSYSYVVFVRIILSWFPIQPPPALRPAMSFLYDLTEPVLRIFRKLLPPVNLGGMALDLSPILIFIALTILGSLAQKVLFHT